MAYVVTADGMPFTSAKSFSQWFVKARDPDLREYYYIYLVYNALTKPKIQVIHNPAEWVERGRLEIQTSEFELSLYDNAQQKLSFS